MRLRIQGAKDHISNMVRERRRAQMRVNLARSLLRQEITKEGYGPTHVAFREALSSDEEKYEDSSDNDSDDDNSSVSGDYVTIENPEEEEEGVIHGNILQVAGESEEE